MTTYKNTEETKAQLGWRYCLDYCEGDVNAKFVTHDHVLGTFKFHN